MNFFEGVEQSILSALSPEIADAEAQDDFERLEQLENLRDHLLQLRGAEVSQSETVINNLIEVNQIHQLNCFSRLLILGRLAYLLPDSRWADLIPVGGILHRVDDYFEEYTDNYYQYNDISDINKSLLYFKFDKNNNDNTVSIYGNPLLIAMIGLELSRLDDVADGSKWIYCFDGDINMVVNRCKYHLLLDGHVLNSVVEKAANNNSILSPHVDVNIDYSQYNDVFNVLSEINSKIGVIDEFLSCYHVLENYMIRAKINSTLANAGAINNVRSFKALGVSMDKKEMVHLTDLFKEIYRLQIAAIEFDAYVKSIWDGVKGALNITGAPLDGADAFNKFLQKLGMELKDYVSSFNNADMNGLKKNIPILIYNVRCCIVHNKDTEYHITNKELKCDICLTVVRDICIPIMKRLAFGLPSVSIRNPVKYTGRHIYLY